MSDCTRPQCDCGKCNSKTLRLPFVYAASLAATVCPADGFMVFVPDGNAPGYYGSVGGKWQRFVTEQLLCELIAAAVKKAVGSA